MKPTLTARELEQRAAWTGRRVIWTVPTEPGPDDPVSTSDTGTVYLEPWHKAIGKILHTEAEYED
jgi:hypothetical protein